MSQPQIYLDHNATTPLCDEAFDAMRPCLDVAFGNPSNRHWAGRAAREQMRQGRAGVAELCGVDPSAVVITSGGTEADVMALHGAVRHGSGRGNHVLTTPLEHPAVLEPLQTLAQHGVIELEMVAVGAGGEISAAAFADALRPDTVLVALMAAHNELGTVYPVVEVTEIAHRVGAHVHCDAVQAAGKLDIAPLAAAVDSLAMSAHKLYGPKGIGALVVHDRARLHPLIEGGGQEQGVRSGTENVPGIAGFGAAARAALRDLEAETERLRGLRERLADGLGTACGERLQRNSPRDGLPNTLHVSVFEMDATLMLAHLDREGIAASSGSACHGGGGGGHSALTHAGLDGRALSGTLRLSLGRGTTEEAIERTVDVFARHLDAASEG